MKRRSKAKSEAGKRKLIEKTLKPVKNTKRSDRRSRLKKKDRYFRITSGYAMIEQKLFESDAFYDLSGMAAMRILLRFHQKAFKKPGKKNTYGGSKSLLEITNNGDIKFTYNEAVTELGYNKATFRNCLKELIDEKGFIDIAEHGVGRGTDRKPTKFSISYRWLDYNTKNYKQGNFNLKP